MRRRDDVQIVPTRGGRVLLLSIRRVADLVAFCLQYEFEDVIDHVFTCVRHPLEGVRRVVGQPCSYAPLAGDPVRAPPLSDRPRLCIDMCNVGRRSSVAYEALLSLASEQSVFYFFDTVAASGAGTGSDRHFQSSVPACTSPG